MLDIRFVRENPEAVKDNIKKKFQDHKLPLVDEVIELDQKARETQQEADHVDADRQDGLVDVIAYGGGQIAQRREHLFRQVGLQQPF